MEFKNYCIVIFEKIDEVKGEINKLSEVNPRYLNLNQTTIGTFCTIVGINELKTHLSDNGSKFLIFELDRTKTSWSLSDIYENHLFSFLKNQDQEKIKEDFENIIKDEEFDESGNYGTDFDEGLTENEKINRILDKGDNMTNEDFQKLKEITRNNNKG